MTNISKEGAGSTLVSALDVEKPAEPELPVVPTIVTEEAVPGKET